MITLSLLYIITLKAFNNISKKVSYLTKSPFEFLSPQPFILDPLRNMGSRYGYSSKIYFLNKLLSSTQSTGLNSEETENTIKMHNIDSYLITRIVALIFIYSGLININFLYVQSIGSGIGLFSGLFFINQTSMIIETLIFITGGLILFAIRPNNLFEGQGAKDKINNTWFQPGMVFDQDKLNWVEEPSISLEKKDLLNKSSLESIKINLNYFLLGNVSNNLKIISNNYLTSSVSDTVISKEIPELAETSFKNKTNLSIIDEEEKIDYSIIVLFSALGSSLLISCNDLISMYLSIELQSFGLYVLSTLYKNSESSTSAGLKYFLLGGLSSCIILLGSGLIYSYSGLTNLEFLSSLNNVLITHMQIDSVWNSFTPNFSMTNYTNSWQGALNETQFNWDGATQNIYSLVNSNYLQGINLGFLLIFIGFLFKIAAAPLHNWSPDVYDDTPTIVTTWLTIIPKLSIIILLLELCFQFYSPAVYISSINTELFTYLSNNDFSTFNFDLEKYNPKNIYLTYSHLESLYPWNDALKNLLLVSSLISLIIGTFVGLAQTKIKRLLAYSTISHIGFILLALGIKSPHSIDSLLFYIIQYTLTNFNIFLILINLSYIQKRSLINLKDIKYISEIKGLLYENPFLSFSLIISLFSLAGIPPLLGFFAKQFTLYAAIQSGYFFISFIAIITSVVSASYYLKIIKLNLEGDDVSASVPNDNKSDVTQFQIYHKNNKLDKVKPSIVVLPSPICGFISFFTLFITLFIFKPSIILSSTGVLSLYLWGFFI